MKPSNRRSFVLHVAAASGALACGRAMAAPKKFEESEAKAVCPKHTASEKCNNCMAWLGKAADPWSECDLTADRLVANGGWCSSYVKT